LWFLVFFVSQKNRMKKLIIIFICFYSLPTFSQEIKSVKITDLEKIITESKSPLIVSMWATWCKPCLEELPYFLEEVKKRNEKNDSIQILLVSLDFKEDYPSGIRSFAKKRKIDAPIVWLDETNADYFCPKIDQKWSGGIPATLFINNRTGYRNFIEEKIKHDDFKEDIKKVLNK